MQKTLFPIWSWNINKARDIIERNYLEDDRPWLIGYSGGKDSSLLLQLVCEVFLKHKKNKRITVSFLDTRLEKDSKLATIKESFTKFEQIGLITSITRCSPDHSFWSTVCGRGYPMPSMRLRYCTKDLKQVPGDKELKQIAVKFGGGRALKIIGMRKQEGSLRKKRLEERGAPENKTVLAKRLTLEALYPIANVTTDELWQYLKDIGAFAWGEPTCELEERYSAGRESRDGCWICPFLYKEEDMNKRCNEEQRRIREFCYRYNGDISKRNLCTTDKQRERLSRGLTAGRFTLEARKEIFDFIMNIQKDTGQVYITPEEEEYIKQCWQQATTTQ